MSAIREKYAGHSAAYKQKLKELRRLDSQATRPGLIAALAVGLTGTLTLDGGLSLVLVAGNLLAGVPVGLLGLALMAAATPVHNAITARLRLCATFHANHCVPPFFAVKSSFQVPMSGRYTVTTNECRS